MSDIERLSITLPATMAESVRQAVAAGDYASTSEVIRDAVRVWQGHRDFSPRDLEVLRRHWDDGKAGGVAGPLDIPALIAAEKAKTAKTRG
jgi:antitoxin ParD1/3/4